MDNDDTPKIGQPALIASIAFMSLPPVIPLYFAYKTEDPTLRLILIAAGVSMLIANAIMVVMIHRWFSRMSDS